MNATATMTQTAVFRVVGLTDMQSKDLDRFLNFKTSLRLNDTGEGWTHNFSVPAADAARVRDWLAARGIEVKE